MEKITWADFEKIDIRTGTIMEVSDFPKARNPSYQLKIDFGELGIKNASAQITAHYSKDQLVGTQVIAVVNFAVKQIGNFFSECLVLGIYSTEKQVILIQPQQSVTNGLKIG